MKILVTGLGGFLGGALGHRLLAEGARLRTLSRRPLPEWEQLGVEVVRGQAPCSPCFLRECPVDFRCMTSVGVDRVVEAMLRLKVR